EIVGIDLLVLAGADPGLGDVAVAGVLQLLEDVVETAGHDTAGRRPAEQAAEAALQDVAKPAAARSGLCTTETPEDVAKSARSASWCAGGRRARSGGLAGTAEDAAGTAQRLVGKQGEHCHRRWRHALALARLLLRPAGRCATADVVEDVEQTHDALLECPVPWRIIERRDDGRKAVNQTRSTKLSTTRFSPALSNAMVSLLPSIAVTLPLPNFWWNTRSPTAKSEMVPVDLATSSPSMVSGKRVRARPPPNPPPSRPPSPAEYASASSSKPPPNRPRPRACARCQPGVP